MLYSLRQTNDLASATSLSLSKVPWWFYRYAPKRWTGSSRYKIQHIENASIETKKTSPLALSFAAMHTKHRQQHQAILPIQKQHAGHIAIAGMIYTPDGISTPYHNCGRSRHCTQEAALGYTHRNTRCIITFRGHNTSQAKPLREVVTTMVAVTHLWTKVVYTGVLPRGGLTDPTRHSRKCGYITQSAGCVV